MILRPATVQDAPAMADLLNRIIAIGGTTAHETPFTPQQILHHYIEGAEPICCHLAEDAQGLIGFQSVGHHPDLPAAWGDIGTFVSPDRQRSGAGAALFLGHGGRGAGGRAQGSECHDPCRQCAGAWLLRPERLCRLCPRP